MAAARRGSASDRWGTLGGDAAGTPGLSDGRSDVYVTRHGSPTEPGAPMPLALAAMDPAELPESSAAYTPGTVVSGAERLVFVSGQPPWASDTQVPEDFVRCMILPSDARGKSMSGLTLPGSAGAAVGRWGAVAAPGGSGVRGDAGRLGDPAAVTVLGRVDDRWPPPVLGAVPSVDERVSVAVAA